MVKSRLREPIGCLVCAFSLVLSGALCPPLIYNLLYGVHCPASEWDCCQVWETHKQAEEPQLWSAAKDPVVPSHLQSGFRLDLPGHR